MSSLDIVTDCISRIQAKQFFTKDRVVSFRQTFFQTTGVLVLLYHLSYIPIFFYRALAWMFSLIVWIIFEFLLGKTTNYYMLLPLFFLCSILSFLLARFSQKKSSVFFLIFIISLLLQSLFILLPIATSMQKQATLASRIDLVKYPQQTNRRSNDDKPVESTRDRIKNRLEDKLTETLEKDSERDFQVSVESLDQQSMESSSLTFRQILYNWLDGAWSVWHQTKLDFQEVFSSASKSSPRYNVSSTYTAYVDLHCFDYTKLPNSYGMSKLKKTRFLDLYRQRSPFPVYLSILQSNGPKCDRPYPNSSCAMSSDSKGRLDLLVRISLLLIIPVIILLAVYRRLQSRKDSIQPKQQTMAPNTQVDLPPQPITSMNRSLDKEIEKKLRVWIEREQRNGYRTVNEKCRVALNEIFPKEYKQLHIQAIQYANAQVHNVSQASVEKNIINAKLMIDQLTFTIKDQEYSVQIPKLTGELQMFFNDTTNEYSIEVKLKHIQVERVQIIDSSNVLPVDEKQLLTQTLTDTICQTTVPCCFSLSDNAEKMINESQTSAPASTPVERQPSIIAPPCETPTLTSSIKTNDQHILPPKEVKNLLVRIVKAVQLHDVEQPFCILELNHPKQIHQTSLAKNGLNPFWDERFLFHCDDKSDQIRLQIIDRRKPNKKSQPNHIDKVYADISIPFAYVTSTIYKQDVRITPTHPDSIIRLEFSTLSEEEALVASHGDDLETSTDSCGWSIIGREAYNIEEEQRQRSPSDDVLLLSYNSDVLLNDSDYQSPPVINPLTLPDNGFQRNKPRKSRSFFSSLRHLTLPRRKKRLNKIQTNENGIVSEGSTPTQMNSISHDISAVQPIRRQHSVTRSFRNLFRSNSKRKPLETSNFIIDSPDFLSTSTPTQKKRSLFRRTKSKEKQRANSSINSLTSYDCTRSESVRNTPVRANGNRPVTMT